MNAWIVEDSVRCRPQLSSFRLMELDEALARSGRRESTQPGSSSF